MEGINNWKFIPRKRYEDLSYQIPSTKYKFYQVCTFVNPSTGKHRVRRFILDGDGNYAAAIEERDISPKLFQLFIKEKKPNEYKLYNVYDLNYVSHPTMGEIMIAQSPILATDSDYSGYAQF
jgi:hypothetical protein